MTSKDQETTLTVPTTPVQAESPTPTEAPAAPETPNDLNRFVNVDDQTRQMQEVRDALNPSAVPAKETPPIENTPTSQPNASAAEPAIPVAATVVTLPTTQQPEPVALDSAAEMTRLREMNEALIAQLNAQASGQPLLQIPQAVTTPQPVAQVQATAQAPVVQPAQAPYQAPLQAEAFVTPESYEEVLRDPAKFNSVLAATANHAVKNVLDRVGPIVANIVQQHQVMLDTSRNFYDKNPDLAPFKPYIGQLINAFYAQEPNLNYEQLVEKAGTEVRTRLKLAAQAVPQAPATSPVNVQPSRTSRPAFAPGTGARQATVNPTGQQRHMTDVLNAAR